MPMRNFPEIEVTHFTVTLVYGDTAKDVLLDIESVMNCEDAECAWELLEMCLSDVEFWSLGPLKAIEIVMLLHGKGLIYRFDRGSILLILHRRDIDVWTIIRNMASSHQAVNLIQIPLDH